MGKQKTNIFFNDTTFFTDEEFNLAPPFACSFNSQLGIQEIRPGLPDICLVEFIIIMLDVESKMIPLLVCRLQINYFWGFYYYQFDDLILNIYTTIF